MSNNLRNKMLDIIHKEMLDANIPVDVEMIDLSQPFLDMDFDSMKVMNVLLEIEEQLGVVVPDNEFMTITANEILNRLGNE